MSANTPAGQHEDVPRFECVRLREARKRLRTCRELWPDKEAMWCEPCREPCRKQGVACWAYCRCRTTSISFSFPIGEEALGRALGETHRRYSTAINARLGVTGHLFQARFGSAAMDEEHLMAAARYVALNPVRARLVERAEDWRWSSVGRILSGRDDGLVSVAPLIERCGGRFADLIETAPSAEAVSALRAAETIGRPVGSSAFLDRLAAATGRDPRPKRRGPKAPKERMGL